MAQSEHKGSGHSGSSSSSGSSGRVTGASGTKDATFNLVSILYHALEGAETYGKYIMDAESEGDRELAEFFQQVKEEEYRRAELCKQHLSRYLSKSGTGSQRRAA